VITLELSINHINLLHQLYNIVSPSHGLQSRDEWIQFVHNISNGKFKVGYNGSYLLFKSEHDKNLFILKYL